MNHADLTNQMSQTSFTHRLFESVGGKIQNVKNGEMQMYIVVQIAVKTDLNLIDPSDSQSGFRCI